MKKKFMDPTKISQQQLDKIAEKIFEANYFHGSVERAISRNINKQIERYTAEEAKKEGL